MTHPRATDETVAIGRSPSSPTPLPRFRPLAHLREQAGRLRWRLGAGYMRVTLAAVVIVETIGLFVLTQVVLMTAGDLQRDAAARLAPVVTEMVAAGVQPTALAAYLDRPTSPTREGTPLTVALPRPPQGFTIVALPEGGFWYDNRRPTSTLPASPGDGALEPAVAPGHLALVERVAADGEPLARRGLVRTAHAVPLIADDGALVGTLLVGSTLLPFTPELVWVGAAILLAATLLVALVGTVYGLSTSRPLVRRIEALGQAADAWSRGDFSVAVRDGSNDELGRLGRRLDRMAEQLQGLVEARQALATSRERTRLARELHDSVKQQVFAAGMRIGAARGSAGGAGSPHLAAAEKLVLQAQQELNDLIHELRPLAVDTGTVGAAIAEMARNDGWGDEPERVLDIDAAVAVPPAVGTALYRIAQEALANVVRHARARRVRISLHRHGDEVELAVVDDGVGFDADGVRGRGVGLASIAERAQDVGGRMEVRSIAGEGTRLSVRVPLPRPERGVPT